jgi:squalene-hopene/tetraprenyl-beta-curcumene cyclase
MKDSLPDMQIDLPPQLSLSDVDRPALDSAISAATQALRDCQREDGHWVFELEADATIPA